MNIALLGYGKMGKKIEELATAKGHRIILKVNTSNQEELTDEALAQTDVAIEFSNPSSAVRNITMCIDNQVPVVSGTTGWLDDYEKIASYCKIKNSAFFYASNFSIGVYMFRKISQQLAEMMNHHMNYKVKMTEVHHTQKLDAPSGTAITLAEDVLQRMNRLDNWHLTDSDSPAPSQDSSTDIPITAERIDHVPGTHCIEWTSEIDTISIEHIAHSREGFAQGALTAAEWILGKKGVFGMEEMMQG